MAVHRDHNPYTTPSAPRASALMPPQSHLPDRLGCRECSQYRFSDQSEQLAVVAQFRTRVPVEDGVEVAVQRLSRYSLAALFPRRLREGSGSVGLPHRPLPPHRIGSRDNRTLYIGFEAIHHQVDCRVQLDSCGVYQQSERTANLVTRERCFGYLLF